MQYILALSRSAVTIRHWFEIDLDDASMEHGARIERPARSPGCRSQAGDLITQPGPGIRAQGGIPAPGRRLVAGELRMVVRGGEAARGIGEPVEQVGSPQRAVDGGELGR